MSLLNDALKKAQTIQAPLKPAFPAPNQPVNTAPNQPANVVPNQPVKSIATPVRSHMPEPAPRSNPSMMSILLIAGVVFAVTVGVLGVGGYFLFSNVSKQSASEIFAQVSTAPAPIPVPVVVAPIEAPVTFAPPALSVPVAIQPARLPVTPSAIAPEAVPPVSAVIPVSESAVAVSAIPSQPVGPVSEPSTVAPRPRQRPRHIPEPEDAAAAIVATVVDFPKASASPSDGSVELISAGEESGTADVNISRDGAVEIIDDSSVVIIDNNPEANELPTRATGVHPDPKIQSWVAQIEVSGVRMGASPKVLMNDRVFTTGDFVDRKTRLKLTGIEERTLIFQDPDGNTYELYF